MLHGLSRHEGTEFPPIEVPASSVGIEEKIVVVDDVAAPCRATSKAAFVPLVEKVLPNLQILQKQSCFGWDAFANLEGVVSARFDNQDIVNSPPAKRQCRCATGNPAAEYDNCMGGGRRSLRRSDENTYSSGVLEFIGQGLITGPSGGISGSSNWLAISRYCSGL